MNLMTYEGIAAFSRRAVEETKRPNCDGSFDPHSKRDRKDTIKHHELIATACEKQVAKKPTENGRCPICGDYFITDAYCSKCGQKIDWR